MRLFCTSVLVTLVGVTDSAGAAQSASGTDGSSVEEVIVTAQKREEQISDVPISITLVSAEALQESGIKTGSALQGMVPGLTINSHGSYGGAPVSIRGTSGLGGAEDPVATYIDGVYAASGSFSVSSLSDIASIEVVRGPQGTLQGRNATAGAIILRTADPEPELGGYLRSSVADPMEYRVEAALTGPITDTLLGRISADYFDEEGWATNLYDGGHIGGHRTKNARAVLLWQPSDAFSLRLAGNYQDRVNSLATARWAFTNILPPPGPAQLTTPNIPPSQALVDQVFERDQVNMNIEPKNRLRTPSGVLQVEYDFGSMSLISITGASEYTNKGVNDSDSLAMTDRQGRNNAVYTGYSFSEELRLQSSTDQAVDWIFGLYYARAQGDMNFNIVNDRLSVPDRRNSNFLTDQVSINMSAFADATWHITDQFSLTGGLRYSEEEKDFESTFTLTNLQTGALLVPRNVFDAPEKSWSDTSYRGKFSWEPNDDVMLYLSHSKGFKAGGFNSFGVGFQPGYDPETLVSNEVGVKAYIWDRRAYIAASVYDNDYDNLQVTSGVPAGGVVITNAANAEIKGFEIEGEFRPIGGFALLANVAYIDSEFVHFPRAPNIIGVQTDVSGNRLTNTPEWQYFIQIAHDTELSANWSARAMVNWRWRDIIYFHPTDQNLAHLRGDPLGELGARVTLTYQPQDILLALYGTNINNDRVVAGQGLTFAYPQAFFNRPRLFGLQVEKRF